MKTFLAFVAKEFRHIFRDGRTMLILLAMPVVQIILFGFAISTEVRNVRVTAVIPERSALAERIAGRFAESEYFTLVRIVPTDRSLAELFKDGSTDLALVFENGFEERMYTPEGTSVQIAVDASDASMSQTWVGYATAILADCQREILPAGTNAGGIVPVTHMLYNPDMKSSYNFVPGIMGVIMLLICAMMTSISIVREKEFGSMELLLASPVRPMVVILSKMTPYFILSVVNLTSILLLSFFVLDVPMAGSLAAIVLVSLLYIFLCLALGLLISSIARTQVTAMLMSGMVLFVPSIMLTGIIFPIENMPRFFQWLSCVMPPRWYVSAIRKLMIEGLPLGYVAKETAVLGAMAAVLVGVSLKKFKHRLE